MKKKFILLFFPLLFFALLTFSQQVITMPFNATIVYTTPQSVSNHVYYLSQTAEGEMLINGSSVSLNVTSISGYIAALGLPPLPLNGVPISEPMAIGDNVYFIYVPGIGSISNLKNIARAYLAYANFTNGSWHMTNLITSGIVNGIAIYNHSVYALWKSSPTGETYLLTIYQNRVVRNVTVNVINATKIEVGNGLGVVSNASASFTFQVTNVNIEAEQFVINLTTGKVIYEIPDYNNVSPKLVSVSNDLLLVSYTSTLQSYLVLYNLSTRGIMSEKSFGGTAIGYINGKFILVEDEEEFGASVIETISIYNLSWGLLYQKSEIVSPLSSYAPEGLFVNSSSVVILLTHISTQVNRETLQVTITSSLKLITALQALKPFTIYVKQIPHPGYTTLNISWNENQSDTYLIYINGTLIAKTSGGFVLYNVTKNGTYLIKIIAENPLGDLEENASIRVTVQPITTTTITSTTTTTSSAIQTQTSTSVTTTTTTSSTTNVTSIVTVVVIVVIIVALALFLVRRK